MNEPDQNKSWMDRKIDGKYVLWAFSAIWTSLAIILGWAATNEATDYARLLRGGHTTIGTISSLYTTSGRYSIAHIKYTFSPEIGDNNTTQRQLVGDNAVHTLEYMHSRIGMPVHVVYDAADPSFNKFYFDRPPSTAWTWVETFGILGILLVIVSAISIYCCFHLEVRSKARASMTAAP